ncbi:MAG: hypothetical protein AABX71_02805 [Nanoarchaeota archaeon]
MKSKKGFEFSFAWLFAILVGAVIIFLAVYGTTKFIKTGRYQLDTVTAKQLSILFEPLEVGLASGKSNIVELRDETKIYNECDERGSFGQHLISLSTESGIGKKWQEPGAEISVPNKYIFSSSMEQGKRVFFFSKAFEIPWKVSEIIFLTTKEYCFVDAFEEVEEEVDGLGLQNIKLENCTEDDTRVCFGSGTGCDIRVRGGYEEGFVDKGEESVFYTEGLIYAAIFSDKEVYECNVKRLMKRLIQQALLYKDEAEFLSEKCESLPSADLIQLINTAKSLNNSEGLLLVRQISEEVNGQNEVAECSLW